MLMIISSIRNNAIKNGHTRECFVGTVVRSKSFAIMFKQVSLREQVDFISVMVNGPAFDIDEG